MTKYNIRQILNRGFLALGYMSLTLQWLWILMIGLPPMIESGIFDSLAPTVSEPSAPSPSMEFSPALAMIAGVITLIFLVITVIVIIKLPKTISNAGEKVIHQTSEAIIPVITHNKKISAKKKRLLTRRVTVVLLSLLVATPLVVSFFIPPVQTITSQIITTLAIWLAGFSAICFMISLLLSTGTTSQTRSRASRE